MNVEFLPKKGSESVWKLKIVRICVFVLFRQPRQFLSVVRPFTIFGGIVTNRNNTKKIKKLFTLMSTV